jgi:tripartite-type tricarboxylate transporter receptor subunit TctC
MLGLRLMVGGLFVFGAGVPAASDEIVDFYRGKRISVVIGYSSGGGYNQYARVFARYFGAHVPGNPSVVVQNMPGAASRKAANWLYAMAPKDGTVSGRQKMPVGISESTLPTTAIFPRTRIPRR